VVREVRVLACAHVEARLADHVVIRRSASDGEPEGEKEGEQHGYILPIKRAVSMAAAWLVGSGVNGNEKIQNIILE